MQVAKADLGTISQGQERSQTKKEPGTGAVERKKTWRFGGSPRVESRRSPVLLSALPLAGPAHPGPGIRANGRDTVGAWPAHRCRPGPPVPSPLPSCVRLGGGPGLRSLRLLPPPPAAGDTGLCSPGPRAIVSPVHGESPKEPVGSRASGSEAGARPETGRRDGLRAADSLGHVDE